jgi:ATP-dependent helicase/nuclease subunit B
LKTSVRLGWTGDAAVFAEWLDGFESHCRREALLSPSLLVLKLTEHLRQEADSGRLNASFQPPLLLVGFDRVLETQKSLLDLWGLNQWSTWQLDTSGEAAQSARFLAAPDAASEMTACVNWLHDRTKENPEARLVVVTTGLTQRRGELERALLAVPNMGNAELGFEFSLGLPLVQVSLARSALLLLRWLHEPITEPELDWLLGCGHCVATAEDEIALAEAMQALRRYGKERPSWGMDEFANATSAASRGATPEPLPESRIDSWSRRLLSVREQLLAMPRRQSPPEWADAVSQLLDSAGWPGFHLLSSTAFQARQRWEYVLEQCASLGFDESIAARGIEWAEFVAALAEAVSATIFAPESDHAQVLITEPLESAGQLANGIWFLGANEENWPGRGQPHPLLPIALQRETGMPHAGPLADWSLAQEATARLLSSADEVVFSYAKHSEETEARPSRLVAQLAGQPQELDEDLLSLPTRQDLTESFEDASRILFPHAEIGGGAATLTRQSLCPFQAFATARLNAEDWQPAQVGLSPKQRGQLLHSVLHRVWGGSKQGGIASLSELQALPDLPAFVELIVRLVLRDSFDPKRRNSLPARFPERYLQLEAERLTRLVAEWLQYERERLPFTVIGTEVSSQVTVAGLTLDLRLDRIDELQNGGSLVVDYKSSEVGPKAWEGDRPDDVQLPLYATFAVTEKLDGLVFARVRPGNVKFYGRVREASASLRTDLSGRDNLVKEPLTEQQLSHWRQQIERLGEDFVAGHSEVDPKNAGQPCETCHLHAVCRIYENQPLAALAVDDDRSEDDAGNDGDNAGGSND